MTTPPTAMRSPGATSAVSPTARSSVYLVDAFSADEIVARISPCQNGDGHGQFRRHPAFPNAVECLLEERPATEGKADRPRVDPADRARRQDGSQP